MLTVEFHEGQPKTESMVKPEDMADSNEMIVN